MNRRLFLRSAAATMALPALESFRASSATAATVAAGKTVVDAKRLVCIGNSFGFYAPQFFPKQAGALTDLPPLLQPLKDQANNLTVFSNLDHGIKGGHYAVHSFLSGVKHSQASGMSDGNITIDQRAAEAVGLETRFPSLVVGSESGLHGGCQMSWTRTGVRVPPIEGPRELFRKLFVQGDTGKQEAAADAFMLRRSILDATLSDANSLQKQLSGRDKDKLDEYFTSIRDVERRIQQQEKWHGVDKPSAPIDEPSNGNIVENIPLLYELLALALETDSTRIASFEMAGARFQTGLLDLQDGYHAYSHHGQRPEAIKALIALEKYQVEHFSKFLDRLSTAKSPSGKSLLDQTSVLFGSGMGNANAHTNHDLPIIMAGRGYQTGTHIEMPKQKSQRVPLSNLFLSILNDLGVEDEVFAHSTGTLTI
ncbi:MAG: DUF1552 domain-containing protein [Verrucomicrobiota bacterium]